MPPNKSNKGKYLFAAIGIGALAAIASSAKAKPAATSITAVTSSTVKSTATSTATKTTATKTAAPIPSANSNTGITSTAPAIVSDSQHAFIDSWNGSEVFAEPGDSYTWLLDSGKYPIVRFMDKTYVGKILGEKGKMYQAEMKTNTGKVYRYWVPKSEVKLMNTTQMNSYLKGEGKVLPSDRLKILSDWFYG